MENAHLVHVSLHGTLTGALEQGEHRRLTLFLELDGVLITYPEDFPA